MQFPPTTLAIDFGLRRLGLAISRASLAEPLKVIIVPKEAGQVDQTGLNQAQQAKILKELTRVMADERPQTLVVGVSEGQMAEFSRAFAQLVADNFNLPHVLVDETLSSQEVERKSLVQPKGKRSGPQDHLAAAEFLQDYLDNWSPEDVR